MKSRQETHVVGGLTEYLSTISRYYGSWIISTFLKIEWRDWQRTETRGSPCTGTSKEARGREQVLRPPKYWR